MTKKEFEFIKESFSQIIDDIAGNSEWSDAAKCVASDLGTLEFQLKGMVDDYVVEDILKNRKTSAIKTSSRKTNPLTQFEIKSFSQRNLLEEYKRIKEKFGLKEGHGIVYGVTEIYIITRSQKVINTLNSWFGSNFRFTDFNNPDSHVHFIE